jgi:hypothetical protein
MDEILNSMKGAQRAEPDPMLYERIRAKIAVPMQVVRRPYLAAAAACLALLITVNVWVLSRQQARPSATTAYQIDQTNFNFYE